MTTLEYAKPTCSEEGCERPARSRGLCYAAYRRAWKAGRLDEHPRTPVLVGKSFDERLRRIGWDEDASGCWIWRGSRNTSGYGQVAYRNKPVIASRAAYEAWVAPLRAGDVVCHRCDNPPCINPGHLFVGDRAANNRDMTEKRRVAHGERGGTARLTDGEVAEIRERYAAGGVSQRFLADVYGVSQSQVSKIIRRQNRHRVTLWPAGMNQESA